ncbi:hypothetical protein [Thalassotalea ganghwensis]
MYLKNILLATATFVLMQPYAIAGLLKSSTSVNITERYCPEVTQDFQGYLDKWGDYMTLQTQQYACVFNTEWEAGFENGSPGIKTTYQATQQNLTNSYIENSDGDIWLDAVLDNSELALPEAHFLVRSQESERNSVNLFSGQSFLWQGESTTLVFSALFDFSMSIEQWGPDPDSWYNLHIGANKGMIFKDGELIPSEQGQSLAYNVYQSVNDVNIIDSNINYRELMISFDVEQGDEFQLWGRSQAWALNGGWVDSRNTMTTQLGVEGLTEKESQEIFSRNLSIVSVPEPNLLSIFILTVLFLINNRRC